MQVTDELIPRCMLSDGAADRRAWSEGPFIAASSFNLNCICISHYIVFKENPAYYNFNI